MALLQKAYLKIRRECIYALRDALYSLKLNHIFFNNARGARIIVYHGICERDHVKFSPTFLTRQTFEAHLRFYKKHFNVISLDDYYLGNFDDNKFNVCITFDDGYANNHKYVLPLIEKYKVPVTFFITAIREVGYDILWNDFVNIISKYGPEQINYIGENFRKGKFNKYFSVITNKSLADTIRPGGFEAKKEIMDTLYPLSPFKEDIADKDYWLQMTPQQISELAASKYATIGSHGYYHTDLSLIDTDDAKSELIRSKQYLESIIDKEVNAIAFPYGTYTRALVEEAKAAGYDQLLAMDFYFDTDKADTTMRERFTVNPFISVVNQMYATINKKYER